MTVNPRARKNAHRGFYPRQPNASRMSAIIKAFVRQSVRLSHCGTASKKAQARITRSSVWAVIKL